MPIYEYQCKKCGHKFEKIQLFSDKPIKKCPECGGAVEKLISRSAVQFKGSGWYVTDYAKKSDGGGSPGGSSKSNDAGDSSQPAAEAATKSESSDNKESKPKKTDSGSSGKKTKK